MGGSSDQVIGYRYFTKFLMFVGNPIEKMLGINFDKRGWLSPFVDEDGNPLAQGIINSPNLYGENEGGVAGIVHVQYGRDDQEALPFYKDYMESRDLQASAYPFQSYLAFTGLGQVNTGNGWIDGAFGALAGHMNESFYVGNSGYMKEMLLWPKRIHVRNDGSFQWYDAKSEIGLEWFEDKTIDLLQNYLDTAGNFVDIYESNRKNSSSGRVYTDFRTPDQVFGGSFGTQGGEIYGINSDLN